jgi:hypothetical protein
MQWPELIDWLVERQKGAEAQWGIQQKQTGADRLSYRRCPRVPTCPASGLTAAVPFLSPTVEALTVIDAEWAERRTV